MRKRVGYIDIARGIAMICIILGHLGNANINRVVFTFHVPIFFLVTGYFTNDNQTMVEFVKRKFRTLIIPYMLTCGMIIALAAIFSFPSEGLGGVKTAIYDWGYASLYGAGDNYTEPFYIKAIGALWFLWATFWGSVLLRIALKLEGMLRILFVCGIACAGYISCRLFWFPLSIQAGCGALLFMYIGYLYGQEKSLFDNLSKETKCFLLIAACIIWMSFIKNFQGFWLVHFHIGRGVIDIFSCLCACICVLEISKFVECFMPRISKGIEFLGRNSLLLLCVHIIELNLFPWIAWFEKLTEIGMPENWLLGFLIVGKLVFDISVTVVCAHCNFIRRAYGMSMAEK